MAKTATAIRGNLDDFSIDPATGVGVLRGWVIDDADPACNALVVRLMEDGAVIGQGVANILRDDGHHGFAVRCTGRALAARAAGGGITARATGASGVAATLNWHPPFLAGLSQLPDPGERAAPGLVTAWQMRPDGIEVATGAVHLRIVAPRHDIIRVRMSQRPEWAEDVSWAVRDAARGGWVTVQALDEQEAVGFATAGLIVRVMRRTGRLLITRAEDGMPVCLDAPGWPPALQGGGFTVHKQRLTDERYFGLGDQPGPLDRTGGAFVLWNTDAGSYQESTTPLYKSVPFYLAARPAGCCGILLDNGWRSHFDFACARRDAAGFGAEGGALDYYVVAGADAAAVLQGYAHLTGLPPLPPLWAFGFQQSRYSYMSADAVLTVADELRRRRIPADVLYCDIDYQDRYRPFTVNPATFPDLPQMVATLAERGFRTVLITDLHIAQVEQGYPPYRSGREGGHFVRDRDGAPYVGESWPGAARFPDFTRAVTRQWWGTLYSGFVAAGVAGFWNDMNEPAVASEPSGTMPLDALHRIAEPGYPERDASHAEIHNVLGQQNARATHEALLHMRPDRRSFVLTRASFAGGQRYGWSWTGDNTASWNHLRMTTPMLANAGLSGLAFIGADVGGFFGAPPPELLTRWFQVAAFHPLFRNHAFTESPPREPWVDGPDHEALRRRAIEERYRLLPYLYTLAETASRTGLPMLRPLFMECPSVLGMATEYDRNPQTQFMVGSVLMVAPPVFGEMLNPYEVILPEGPWFDYWSGARLDAAMVTVVPALDRLAVYARGGSIVPRQTLVQHTGERPEGPLELVVYPGVDCTGTLYADDGVSHRYRDGQFLRQDFTFNREPGAAAFRFLPRAGAHAPWWANVELILHDMDGLPVAVSAERGEILMVTYDAATRAQSVLITDPRGAATVTLEFGGGTAAGLGI